MHTLCPPRKPFYLARRHPRQTRMFLCYNIVHEIADTLMQFFQPYCKLRSLPVYLIEKTYLNTKIFPTLLEIHYSKPDFSVDLSSVAAFLLSLILVHQNNCPDFLAGNPVPNNNSTSFVKKRKNFVSMDSRLQKLKSIAIL